MLDVATNAIGAISDLAVKVAQEIGNALQLDDKGLCIAPSCPGAFGHINSGDEEDLVEELDDLEILASQLRAHAYRFPLTQRTLELPTHSPTHRQRVPLLCPLASAMLPEAAPFVAYVAGAHHSVRLLQCERARARSQWPRRRDQRLLVEQPCGEGPFPPAVKDAVDEVIKPIEAAVNEVKKFVNTLKEFFEGLSFRRRLEELTTAEVAHARGLKDQAHRQLEQVRGRLLHIDSDDARGSTNQRLVLDTHRRLEAHLAERKLAARQLGSDDQLISISSLKASITLEIDSRMLIEGQKDDDLLLPLVTEDKAIDMIIGLAPTPFVVKLSAAFSADIHLEVKVEGDLKALVHLVASGMGVTFDLSTGADTPAVFSEGDWTQTITLEAAL
eukprot:scaffold30802_cov61-Phaeocystis_antarctica.AAC.2